MILFDAHNHIQDERLFSQLQTVMTRAQMAGVRQMAVKGCCENDWGRIISLVNNFEGIFPAFGLHPWFIDGRSSNWVNKLENLLTSYPQASVGEIGIDHAINPRNDAEQEAVFLTQLKMAQKFNRPVSIHCRQTWGRLIELLDQVGELPRGMLIHCFGGSAEIARELVKRGAYISFSGSITRPNNKKAGTAIQAIPADRLLIETDAPDILPHNGTTQPPLIELTNLEDSSTTLNEPANLRYVLTKAAELYGMSETELAQLTTQNARRFFE